jgi:hypothetical protein
MPVTGKCECGKCTVTQRQPGGIALWKCHCSHCRTAALKDPEAQGRYDFHAADWCCNFKVKGPKKGRCTVFTPGGCPCPIWGVYRQNCAECGTPVINWGHGALTGFAIVNMAMIRRSLPEAGREQVEAKCTASFETFYNSGLGEGHVADKTYYSEVGSTVGLLWQLVCVGAPAAASRACCCVGWGDLASVAAAP